MLNKEMQRHEHIPDTNEMLPKWLKEYISQNEIQAGERITQFGDMWIASANYGEILTNTMLVEEVLANCEQSTPEQKQKIEQIIDSTGITVRYRSPSEKKRDRETVLDDTGRIVAHLLGKTVNQSGLLPTHLIVSNLDLPISLNSYIKKYSSFLPNTVTDESIRAACAGGVLGMIKALADTNLKHETVAIIAAEPTGHLQHPLHYTPEHMAIPAIFTDMYSIMILQPKDFELIDYALEIIPGGGISVQTSYDEEATLVRNVLPDYLQENTTCTNDHTPSIFRLNDNGIFLDIPFPNDGMTAIMDGEETGIHFSRYGATFIDTFLQKNNDWTPSFIFAHQPSRAVIRRINKILKKNYPEHLIPFDLPDMYTGNGTSAVTVRHLQHIVTTKQPDPHQDFIGITMGIGSILGAIRMRQR